MIRGNCPESYNEFLDSYLFNLRSACVEFSGQSFLKVKATIQTVQSSAMDFFKLTLGIVI